MWGFLNNLKIGQRLNLINGSLVTFLILILTIYNYQNRKNEILDEVSSEAQAELNDYYNFLEAEIGKNKEYVNLGLNFFEEGFSNEDLFSLNNRTSLSLEVTNQFTKEKQRIELPLLTYNGNRLINNFDTVDQLVEKGVASATIFQRFEDGFLRITTSIKKNNGERAVGTFIPNSSPVSKALMRGDVYKGRAYVVNDWYLTAYSPIYVDGKIEGALYVGMPEKELANLENVFYANSFFGEGYPFLVSSNGALLIHPSDEGENVSDEEFFTKITKSGNDKGEISYVYEGDKKYLYYHYVDEIDAYLAITVFESDIRKAINDIIYINALAALIFIILFILAGFALSRSITQGLLKGVNFATELSNGNLSHHIDYKRKDEIGVLIASLNNMAEKLKETVAEISSGAYNISSASSQTSSTSEELSQGASEQATTVEEVSSTMEEITASIETSNENAQNTNAIIGIARESIKSVIEEALSAIEYSKQISSKIEIISDISFQTNILALNAAVEAARAGEAGNGFSVVADEVRRLAENTKESAKEITDITKVSMEKTESSSENLTKLLPEIEKIMSHVNEITSSSEQQSLGVTQINESIQELNKVAQQNAAASEEMAANAEEMTAQAESLSELISFFKVKDAYNYVVGEVDDQENEK